MTEWLSGVQLVYSQFQHKEWYSHYPNNQKQKYPTPDLDEMSMVYIVQGKGCSIPKNCAQFSVCRRGGRA
jgi:hypothetical protein